MKDSYVFYKDKLNAEYKSVFEQVEMYVLTQNIDESTMEERLGELLDSFLSAQNAGKQVQKITGDSIERFCRTFCSDFGPKNRVMRILDWVKSIAWVLVAISALDVLWLLLDASETGEFDLWHSISSLNLSMYLIAVTLFGFLFIITNLVLRRLMFKKKQVSMGVWKTAVCVEAVISFAGIYAMISMIEWNLFVAPTWIVALVSGIYLLVYYPILGKKNRRRKVKFSDLVEEDFQKETAKTMTKKFEKAKVKSLKKGKGELSLDDFLEQEENLCAKSGKTKYFYYTFPAVLTAVLAISQYLSEGFDSHLDAFLYIAIMLAIEYSIILWFYKLERKSCAARMAWIQSKREESQSSHTE